jgi:MerR family transcriptional regulator, light-induced transcriptional regulator
VRGALTDQLSLHDVADQLGVHYMTVYRYVRLGLLPANKVGTSWVVTAADLARFQAGEGSEGVRGPGRATKGDGKWAQRLEARLLAGDARGAWSVIETAQAGGADLDEVYLEIVAPALRGVGDRWEAGEIDVAVEHRASTIVTKVLGRLAPRMARRGRSRGTVVLGAAPGERHALPVTLVADLVRAQGFEVDDLGADVPASSFATACADAERLVAVGISASTSDVGDGARSAVEAIRARRADVPILMGGAAVASEAEARELGADHWAADARQAVTVLDAIVARTGRRPVT